MDRRGTRDKMAPVVKEDPPVSAKTCPHCGLPLGFCRETPRGFYCQAKGLISTAAHTMTSVQPDLVRPLVDSDPEVVDALAELRVVEEVFAKRDAEFREIALAGINARATFGSQVRFDYANERMIYPKGSGLADQNRLERQQMRASEIRDETWQLVVRAREQVEAVRRRSRARLTQPAA